MNWFQIVSCLFDLLVQLKFEEGVIGTPQLTDSLVIPEDVEFLGQKIDLAPFKGLLTSVQDTASSVVKSISSQPPLKFSISSTKAESWLLTTYLDQELRISRGDNGSVFVLIKEGSSLLTPWFTYTYLCVWCICSGTLRCNFYISINSSIGLCSIPSLTTFLWGTNLVIVGR